METPEKIVTDVAPQKIKQMYLRINAIKPEDERNMTDEQIAEITRLTTNEKGLFETYLSHLGIPDLDKVGQQELANFMELLQIEDILIENDNYTKITGQICRMTSAKPEVISRNITTITKDRYPLGHGMKYAYEQKPEPDPETLPAAKRKAEEDFLEKLLGIQKIIKELPDTVIKSKVLDDHDRESLTEVVNHCNAAMPEAIAYQGILAHQKAL